MIYEFAATQDLHGYDSPWPAGGGKNKLKVVSTTETINGVTFTVSDSGVITVNGTASATTVYQINAVLDQYLTIGENYILNGSPVNTETNKWKLRVYNSADYIDTGNGVQFKFKQAPNDDCEIIVYNGTTMSNVVFYPMIRLASVSDATFAPYSNICPLTGFNIWDPLAEDYTQVYAGYVNSNTRELLLRPVYPEYSGEELVGPWMSSFDEYAEDTTPTEGAFVVDLGGELTSYEITPFMLQSLLDSLGIRQNFTDGASLLNSLMDQAQGRVRSEEELLHLSRPLNVIAIGDQLPAGITFKPISKDVLPGLPGKFIR